MLNIKRFFLSIIFISTLTLIPNFASAVTAKVVTSPYYYTFTGSSTVEETGSMGESWSPYWWMNSGGQLVINNGLGMTMKGEALAGSVWRLLYAQNNSLDTDNGFHPQNIFRLLTRNQWQNERNEVEFKIIKDNLSASPNRNASNGLLLMNRYVNSNNLYYLGVRVDGAVVIKKKINGTYYTLAYKKVFPGIYNVLTSPNLLPKNTPMVLRSEVVNGTNGSVNLKLYMDLGKTGTFTKLLDVTDDAKSFGGAALTSTGYAGIRTDFMDVEFGTYKMCSM